ncbi:MAG: hypothetical protein AUK63_400 [bacterium P3]|nr:MAG: hypothetical protein AUK63_400 [bacterium P3]KWW42640.1 MAG: hypothetical protein F083_44 [bacterium F083]
MKTIKFIAIAATMLLGLASCSDEKKAINFVSKEVLPEKEIENELIKHLTKEYCSIFPKGFYYYFNIDYLSNGGRSTGACIKISEDYQHKYHRGEYWLLGLQPNGHTTSEKILDTICRNGLLFIDETFKRGDNLDSVTATSLSLEQQYNKLASIVIKKDDIQVYCDLYANGIISINPEEFRAYYDLDPIALWGKLSEKEKNTVRELKGYDGYYNFDWTMISRDKQQEIIKEYANWQIVRAREKVKQNDYKLIDKSCITIGENDFEVRYLLEPQWEIVFSVRKVGKTFVSDGYWVEGIIQDSNSNI